MNNQTVCNSELIFRIVSQTLTKSMSSSDTIYYEEIPNPSAEPTETKICGQPLSRGAHAMIQILYLVALSYVVSMLFVYLILMFTQSADASLILPTDITAPEVPVVIWLWSEYIITLLLSVAGTVLWSLKASPIRQEFLDKWRFCLLQLLIWTKVCFTIGGGFLLHDYIQKVPTDNALRRMSYITICLPWGLALVMFLEYLCMR